MSDTIWAAIITSISALLIAMIKGVIELKRIRIQTQSGAKDDKYSEKRPSAKFSTYLWQTQKIPLALSLFFLASLVNSFLNAPDPITPFFVFYVGLNFSLLVSIDSSILIFYLIRLTSGSLKEPE